MSKKAGFAKAGVAVLICMCAVLAAGQGHITQAVLGTGVTNQFEITGATSEFTPDTPKIYCAWKAEGVKGGTPVRGTWIAEDVGTAAPKNYKIDEKTLTLPLIGPSQGSFSISKPNKGFPVGKYRLEIYLGGTLSKTVPFTVKAK